MAIISRKSLLIIALLGAVAEKLIHVESLPARVLIDRDGSLIQRIESAEELKQVFERVLR